MHLYHACIGPRYVSYKDIHETGPDIYSIAWKKNEKADYRDMRRASYRVSHTRTSSHKS
jgi:hypothetical protein